MDQENKAVRNYIISKESQLVSGRVRTQIQAAWLQVHVPQQDDILPLTIERVNMYKGLRTEPIMQDMLYEYFLFLQVLIFSLPSPQPFPTSLFSLPSSSASSSFSLSPPPPPPNAPSLYNNYYYIYFNNVAYQIQLSIK